MKPSLICLAGLAISASVLGELLHKVERENDILFAKPDGVELLLDLHLPAGVENPPLIMIIHGAKDKTVYLDQSEMLEAAYKEAGLDAELLVETEKGHGWKSPGDAEKGTVLAFLKRQFAQ